jgi:hypothetical protein
LRREAAAARSGAIPLRTEFFAPVGPAGIFDRPRTTGAHRRKSRSRGPERVGKLPVLRPAW